MTSSHTHPDPSTSTTEIPDNPSDVPSPVRDEPARRGALGYVIFASRWLQAPLYLGLIVAQLLYVIVFLVELWHLTEDVLFGLEELNEAKIMLAVLGLIDVVMIANLLIMVIMGGYEIFVSRLRVNDHPDQPDWLNHVNANVLKVKLAISIISISSIHLLRTFIEVGNIGAPSSNGDVTGETYTSEGVFWQVMIHLAFIVSALALAWIDKMSQQYHPEQRP
ncbi:TIGR00645 family protein [Gulosibacter sp. 10]|uniref:TIGR00645 family protein n=1 Tax=Gulosibacter sp. 10 TaxID=1255570 RepID=UPI00097F4B28|nr:TIGR00645 family protein [Gulosibacter sp. 10]SJM62622.1 putative membrane protein [Gulosibacter sp. 10]